MDRTDTEIITLLQQNARISMSEISGHVNLSVSAVSERLKKLEQAGLVSRYTAILNPLVFHKTLQLFLRVEFLAEPDFSEAENYIASEPDILEYHILAGGCHGLLKIVTEDTVSLTRITDKLRSFRSIGRIEADLITASPKAEPSVKPVP